MISEKLRKLLVCPACHGAMIYTETKMSRRECREDYPVREGVPVLIAAGSPFYSPPETKGEARARSSLRGWLQRLMIIPYTGISMNARRR